jgi:DNA-binding transcriptional LysR family regulator
MPIDTLALRLDNRLKMRHYVLLIAIDKHRSVTRVAEQLSLSQPTVTRALADIEDIFMSPLFLRTRRGLEPTPAGEVVLAHARFAVADNDALRRELDVVRSGRQGRLRLGLIPYVSTQALDAAWQHLFALRPRIALLAQEDTTANLITAIRDRSLDCAICRFSHDSTDDDLQQDLLYRQQSNLVVAKASAALLARKPALDIGQLSEMDWIFPPSNTPVRKMIDAVFAAAGRRVPVPLMEAYALRTVEAALRQLPRGVTILPSDIAHAVAASGAAVVLPQPLPWNPPPVGLAWLRGSPKTEIIAGLAEAVRAGLPAESGPAVMLE